MAGMTRLRRTLCCAPALALLLPLAACGDDGPTQEEYVAEVNAICAENAEALSGEDLPEDPERLGDALEDAVEEVSDTLEEIEGVERPPEDDQRIQDEFLDPVRAQVDQVEEVLPEVQEALEEQDLQRLSELSEQLELEDAAGVQEFLQSYGLTECAELGR
jgi:hypothetical protein